MYFNSVSKTANLARYLTCYFSNICIIFNWYN